MILRLNRILKYAFLRTMVTDTIERLRAALKKPGITKRLIAEKAGIHRMTLQGCEDPDWNPKASTLIAIEPHLPPVEDAA